MSEDTGTNTARNVVLCYHLPSSGSMAAGSVRGGVELRKQTIPAVIPSWTLSSDGTVNRAP